MRCDAIDTLEFSWQNYVETTIASSICFFSCRKCHEFGLEMLSSRKYTEMKITEKN